MKITTRFARLKAGLAAAALLAAGTAVAVAAEPESGTVSPQNPKVTWEGTLTSSGVHYNVWADDPSVPCEAPVCDTFALTVDGGKQDLTIGLNIQDLSATGSEPGGGIRVEKPNGDVEYTSGTSGPKTTLRHRIRGAEPGEYQITVAASYICCGDTAYIAFAEVPAAGTTGPAPEPGGEEPPPPPQLTISGPKSASAKKLRKSRRLDVTVQSSGPVRDVSAGLLKGSKAIATGKLAALDGKQRLRLKASKKAVRKLKPGTYTLSVSGTDQHGRTVGGATKIKLRK